MKNRYKQFINTSNIQFFCSVALMFCLFAPTISKAQTTDTIFYSSGTWICPKAGTVTVMCWGGGGGGLDSATALWVNIGGGGGAFATITNYTVVAGSYNVHVGAGGAGNVGADGGNSYFVDTLTVNAVGGSGANNVNAGAGGRDSACTPINGSHSGGSGGIDGFQGCDAGGGAGAGSAGEGGAGMNGSGGNDGGDGGGGVYAGGAGGSTLGYCGTGYFSSPVQPGGGGASDHDSPGQKGADGEVIIIFSAYPLSVNNSLKSGGSNPPLALYPNPAGNELRITSGELRMEKIEFYNILGEKIFTPALYFGEGRDETVIDVSLLSPGIYFVKVDSENNNWVGKFVKRIKLISKHIKTKTVETFNHEKSLQAIY